MDKLTPAQRLEDLGTMQGLVQVLKEAVGPDPSKGDVALSIFDPENVKARERYAGLLEEDIASWEDHVTMLAEAYVKEFGAIPVEDQGEVVEAEVVEDQAEATEATEAVAAG